MKKFIVPVVYTFNAFFSVNAESNEEALQIVKDKTKVIPGVILTQSVAIQNKEISSILPKYKDVIEVTLKDEA
jgi:hypothetical protein